MGKENSADTNVLNSSDIIYMIMTDRYPDGDPSNNGIWGAEYRPGQLKYHQGGDFRGIIEKLDYLCELGITAIWISPPQTNEHRNKLYDGSSYHGYNTHDFNSIDPHFGTREELQELIDKAHQKGIKMITDAVPNHTADYLDPFATEYSTKYPADFRPAPPFDNPEWYHHNGDTINWNDQWELENTDIGGLDDLAHEKEEVQEAIISAYKKLTGMGFDGIRIDAATSIPKWFLEKFQEEMGIPCFGETYNASVDYVSDYQRHIWGVLDFPLFFAMVDVFASDKDVLLLKNILDQDFKYQDSRHVVTFLDNHDRNRFLCVAEDNYRKLLMGLSFLFAARGIPDIYYGTEQGFHNSDGVVVKDSIIDHQNREVMDVFDTENPIFKHIKRLTQIRKENPVLVDGVQKELISSDPIYSFIRSNADKEYVLSVFNNGYEMQNIEVKLPPEIQIEVGTCLTNLLDTRQSALVEDHEGKKVMHLALGGKCTFILTPGEVEEYIPDKLVETKICVSYVGDSNDVISLRGNRYPLWSGRNRRMRKAGANLWEFTIYRMNSDEVLEFSVVLNQDKVSKNIYQVNGGSSIDIFPEF